MQSITYNGNKSYALYSTEWTDTATQSCWGWWCWCSAATNQGSVWC